MSIEIPTREGDDGQFLRMVRRVALGTLASPVPVDLEIVRVDGWFGERYLEQEEVRFPPERILGTQRAPPGDAPAGEGAPGPLIVLWFSSETANQPTGSIMVRPVSGDLSGGWHASFVREGEGWGLRRSRGIGPSQFAALVERGRD